MQNRQTPRQGVCPTHHSWYHTHIFPFTSSHWLYRCLLQEAWSHLPCQQTAMLDSPCTRDILSLLTGDQHKPERVDRLLGWSFPPPPRLIDANRCLQIKLLLSGTPTGTRSPLWDWQTEIFGVLVFQSWNYPYWVSFPSHLSVVSIETPRWTEALSLPC